MLIKMERSLAYHLQKVKEGATGPNQNRTGHSSVTPRSGSFVGGHSGPHSFIASRNMKAVSAAGNLPLSWNP